MRWLLVIVLACAACAPVVDGPAERQRVSDRSDSDRLTAQLQALPGVERAEVMLRRPVADPLSTTPAPADALSIVVIVDQQTDRAAITTQTKQLAAAAVPGIEPALVVEVGAPRPALAKVGPFTVEAGSKGPIKVVFAIVLGLVVLLASWVFVRERSRT